MKIKKTLAIILALCMAMVFVAACKDDGGREAYVAPEVNTNIPRNEAVFFGGLMWNPVNAWNPHHGNASNFANDQGGRGTRPIVWETPYMYNATNGAFVPLLADGDFEWSDNFDEITYKIKSAAYWSDGTKVTAHDAAYSWEFGFFTTGGNAGWLPYIQSVTAADDETVVIKAVMDPSGVPVYAGMVEQYIYQNYILQKEWLERMGERAGWEGAEIAMDVGEDMVWSGPYTRYFDDEWRSVLIRDDNYWGQDDSMWGKLPAPKYLVNLRYSDNTGILAAMQAGDIDMSQSYVPDVNLLWEQHGLPFSTYYTAPPYHLSADIPTVWFNMRDGAHPALKEVVLRRAIAWAVDYDTINANAMTFQSPTFAEVPRSLHAANDLEQSFLDGSRLRDLQWIGKDIDGANRILDESGLFPKGADGWRTYNGEKMSFSVSCPYGWNDWEAACEVVAAAGQEIGIEMTTYFPQEGEFYDYVTVDPTNPELDIFMMWTGGLGHTQPWGRVRNVLSSEWLSLTAHNWTGNWGHYSNARVDELIAAIPLETDQAKLIDLYTEIQEIYLTDVPSFAVMYRPDAFHTAYEGVWTGWTEAGDGRNVPPLNALSGYAVRDLYDLYLVG